MESSLYPNIIYLTNRNLAFLGTAIAEKKKLNLFHPSSHLNNHYADLTCRLFNEIKIIKEMLWIGKVPSTQVIRIYFSEPYDYPATYCCRYPVFIEVENDKSGKVLCSKCSKEVMRFVKAGKGSDEEMFRVVQKQTKDRKDELKSLLTSLKFRGKKLRDNFINGQKTNNNDLIVEIIEDPLTEPVQSRKQDTKLQPSLLELKDIILDIFS